VYPRIVSFSAYFSRHVGAGFTGGQVSSDGGALLLREVDRKINFLARLANCFTDQRAAGRVERSLPTMLAQRSFPHVRRACLPAAFPPEHTARKGIRGSSSFAKRKSKEERFVRQP